MWKFTGNLQLYASTATPVLREAGQSKCIWTFHESHFVWKFAWETAVRFDRNPRFARACAVEMHMDVEIYRENAERAGYHPD